MKTKRAEVLKIAVELDREFDEKARGDASVMANVEVYLRQRTEELLDDLGVRAGRKVSILFQPKMHANRLWQYRAYIEGQPCRQQIGERQDDPVSFVQQLATTVFENRDLLLPDAILMPRMMELLEEASLPKGIDDRVINEIARSGVALGYGLPTVARFIAMLSDQTDWDDARRGVLTPSSLLRAPTAFESQMSFELLVASEMDDQTPLLIRQFSLTSTEIFEELGLELPQLKVVRDSRLAPGQLRARFNDLRGPVFGTATGNPTFGFSALKAQIVRYAPLTVSDALVEYALGKLNNTFPMLVFSLIETKGVEFFAAVVREMLAERMTIRDLISVLDAVLGVNGVGPISEVGMRTVVPPAARIIDARGVENVADCSPADYADYVRGAVRDRFNQSIAVNDRVTMHRASDELESFLLSSDEERFEETVRDSVLEAIPVAALEPGHALVAVTTAGCRALHRLICVEFADLPVLCERERGGFVNWVEGAPISPDLGW